jgi:sugar phosphate isomerase/epimerase
VLKISCAGYTFNTYFREKGLALDRYLEICAEMRLDGVELTQYYFPETGPAYLNGLKRQMLKLGLELAGCAIGGSFAVADEERKKHIEFTKEWLDISARLGAPVLRVFAGPAPKGHSEDEAFAWVISGIKECAKQAEKLGVMIGVENHGGTTGTAEGLLRILEGVGSDWVGALLDFGNFSKDPYREFEMIAPHAIMTHSKPTSDFAGTRGELDYGRICATMTKAGYRGFLSIEYEEPGKDAMVEVPRFAAYLRGVQW